MNRNNYSPTNNAIPLLQRVLKRDLSFRGAGRVLVFPKMLKPRSESQWRLHGG